MLKSGKLLKNKKYYGVDPFYEEWAMKLNGNESAYEPPFNVIQAIQNIDISKIQYYPAYGELKQAIAGFYGLKSSNIIATNGADEAISLICQTYLEKGDSILTVAPTFVMSKFYSELSGAKYVQVPYIRENGELIYPYKKFEKSIKARTKIILFTTPNNPTGDVVDKEFIEKIAEKYPNKVILIDETYSNYSNYSYFNLVKKYDNVFVVKSFSKDFALAGLRLGFIASKEDNIYEIKKVKSPYNVNAVSIVAGIQALKNVDYLQEIKAKNQAVKDYLYEELELLGAKVYKSYANFVLVDFKEKAAFVYHKLRKYKIITKFFENDKVLKNCIRITIPTMENAKILINILKSQKTFVFDMDGVIVDVQNSYRRAIIETVKHFTDELVTQEEIINLKNLGGYNNDWDITEKLINDKGVYPKSKKIIEVFEKIYWNDGEGLIKSEELIAKKEILEEFSKHYNLAIFTGRPRTEAHYTLDLFGLKNYFYPIITMEDVGINHQKPDTKGLELIKERTYSRDIIYFGDTVDDIKCGKNAGVNAIGVLPPQDKSKELENLMTASGATMVLNNINNIKALVEIANAK